MELVLIVAFIVALALATATRQRALACLAIIGVLSVIALTAPTVAPHDIVDLHTTSHH